MASDPNVPINPPGGPYFTQRLWSEEVAIARAEAGDLGSNRDPSYEFGNGRKFVEPVSRVWGEGRAAPTLIVAPVIAGNNYDGSTLTSTTGTWDAYPVPEYAYQWTADGANVGSNQNTYVTQVGDVGASIVCTVTATNEDGTASRGSNAITVTASTSPSNTVAPVVSGSQPAGSTLTSTTGTWTANPAVSSYSYQWKADAGNVGTNQATYVTQVGDVGKSITCTVTATNVKGSGSQASNGVTVTAALAAPANTVAPVVSGDSASGSTLTSTTGTWTGNPTPTYAYQWKSDGSNVGSNQNTYVTQYGDVGKSVTCTVTATNSQGNSSQASNGITVTVSNPDAVIDALFANSEVGAWYDPSDLTTMFQDIAGTTPVTADGQTVGKILDKSGNDNHAVAPSDAARPLYKTDGTYHWLQFDGVDDYVQTAVINKSGWASGIAVYGFKPTAYRGGVLSGVAGATSADEEPYTNDNWYFSFGGISRADAQGTIALNAPSVMTRKRDSTTTSGRRNGSDVGSPLTCATDFNGSSAVNVGAGDKTIGNYLTGNLYSLILRAATSTAQEITDTETWVNTKTGAF